MHEHPTQALLDAFTIRERKKRLKGLEGRDRRRPAAQPRAAVEHPAADEDGRRRVGVRTADADADRHRAIRRDARRAASTRRSPTPTSIMLLRIQLERMEGAYLPSLRE